MYIYYIYLYIYIYIYIADMFHIINAEPSVNYSNMKEDHFIILT